MSRIVLVGYSPQHGADPSEPLGVTRPGSGRHLARLCGLTLEEYVERFERVNLFYRTPPRPGPARVARWRAAALLERYRGRRLVLLGNLVAAVFLQPTRRELFRWVSLGRRTSAALVPHPSGLNRWYNDAGNRRRAERFLRSLT